MWNYWTLVWHSIKFSTFVYVISHACYYGIHGALYLGFLHNRSQYVCSCDNQKSHSTPVL